ncbi:MAG: hypothetical protein HY901_37235 [Deltaproteobacteria bacterium]|nr:hypothetical protein [Deltaproteobacteria bacterium]
MRPGGVHGYSGPSTLTIFAKAEHTSGFLSKGVCYMSISTKASCGLGRDRALLAARALELGLEGAGERNGLC